MKCPECQDKGVANNAVCACPAGRAWLADYIANKSGPSDRQAPPMGKSPLKAAKAEE